MEYKEFNIVYGLCLTGRADHLLWATALGADEFGKGWKVRRGSILVFGTQIPNGAHKDNQPVTHALLTAGIETTSRVKRGPSITTAAVGKC